MGRVVTVEAQPQKVGYNKRKRYLTLIEMMIVILLIALIGGVLAYNLRGGLDEGRGFKTTQGIQKVEDILNYELAKGTTNLDTVSSNWQEVLRQSALVSNPNDLINDGWGRPYEVTIVNGVIHVESQSGEYQTYLLKNPQAARPNRP